MNTPSRSILALGALLLAMATSDAAPRADLVLVAGATGRTGRQVVEQLVARNYRVRALTRDAARAGGQFPSVVELVVGDVRDPASLQRAMKGVRYVISTVGAGGGPNPEPGNGPNDIDHLGVANLAQAAKRARVRQIVIVSSMAVTKAAEYPLAFMRPILAAKAEGEAAVRRSGVPYTILRPGGLLDEPGGKWAVQFAQGDTTIGRIPRADVATACIEALGRRSALSRTAEILSSKTPAPNAWAADFAALKADPPPLR